MRGNFTIYIRPLVITLLLLILCEVLSTSLLPLIGLESYRMPFHILIVLYFGFKLDSPYTSVIIFFVQYFHSFFSIEGWEMGTIAGIFICLVMTYLRELIHFRSVPMTIFITQVFQFVWFGVVSLLLYVKYSDINYIVTKFWFFLPESIFLSFSAPFLFFILDTIWSIQSENSLSKG